MKFKKIRFYLLAAVLLVAVTGSWTGPSAQDNPEDLARLRTRLLTHMIRQQMTVKHFSHKVLDDTLSESTFDLYVQQLDSQKRFLTQSDMDELRQYRDNIDDAIVRGDLLLPSVGARLLRLRIGMVSDIVPKILDKGFNFKNKESFETDPDKIGYAKDDRELQKRWQQILKYQVLMRYVQLLEDRQKTSATATNNANSPQVPHMDPAMLKEASQKVQRSIQHLLTRLLEQTEQDHFDRFINAFVRAYDPHSAYMAPDALEDFEIYMKGSLEGIGATLREDDGFIRIVEIIPGSPAAKQGQLSAEDIIIKVGEGAGEPVDVTDTRLRDAVQLIRGKKGTEVRLTIQKPTGREQIIAITRDVVEIEEGFAKSTTIPVSGQPGQVYGYLRIPSFYRDFQGSRDGRLARNVTDDVRGELASLKKQGITGLVLDLRNNGGGSLADAISVAGLFISTGPVVQVKSSDGNISVFEDDDPEIAYSGPLVVLVNRFSASASEILAGAIQDYGRGVVIGGGGTHGKGTVQAIFDMDQPLIYGPLEKLKPLGALKVTVQKFYRINGGSTQVKGIEPDIQLPDRLAFLESGEKHIDYALPWDIITAVPYQRWAQHPDIVQLRHLSQQRVEKGHRFDALVVETQRNLQRSRETLRSLNLAEVLLEAESMRKNGSPVPGADLDAETPQAKASAKPMSEEIADDLYVGEAVTVLTDMKQQFSVEGRQVAEPVLSGM